MKYKINFKTSPKHYVFAPFFPTDTYEDFSQNHSQLTTCVVRQSCYSVRYVQFFWCFFINEIIIFCLLNMHVLSKFQLSCCHVCWYLSVGNIDNAFWQPWQLSGKLWIATEGASLDFIDNFWGKRAFEAYFNKIKRACSLPALDYYLTV